MDAAKLAFLHVFLDGSTRPEDGSVRECEQEHPTLQEFRLHWSLESHSPGLHHAWAFHFVDGVLVLPTSVVSNAGLIQDPTVSSTTA